MVALAVFVNITDNAASGSDKYAVTGRARARRSTCVSLA